MKKPKDKDQPVTIGDFQEFAEFSVKTFATKQDLKDELKRYATKDDLKEVELRIVKKMDATIRVVVREEIRPVEERLEKKITEFKDVILNSNDKLVRKLDTFITEQAMMAGGQSRHETDIKHLKQRVTHLEVKAGIA